MAEEVSCPFCGENGFDLIGLKQHLEGTFLFAEACDAYVNTMTPQEEADARRVAGGQSPGSEAP